MKEGNAIEQAAGELVSAILRAGEDLDQGVEISLTGLHMSRNMLWKRMDETRLGSFVLTVKRTEK